ncbi:hypothetical protein FQN57_000844 [Myotisia sp. PD_48]|nr:hypothetical protein FQN57_000844 [Myotisia sp. PD_48]
MSYTKKRKRLTIENDDSPKQTSRELRSVKTVNALPFQEFIERFVPRYALDLRLPPDVDNGVPSSDTEEGISSSSRYTMEFYTAASIPDVSLQECFELIRLTSSEDYKNSSSGWSPKKKKKEMKLKDMKYIVLVPENKDALVRTFEKDGTQLTIGGFLSFMVTHEDGIPVLYCYEIHLAPDVQGKGMGKQLVRVFNDIGYNIALDKGMLTVFKSNKGAIEFYERRGFTEDEFSPRRTKLRNGKTKEYDYMIMSISFMDRNAKQEDTQN